MKLPDFEELTIHDHPMPAESPLDLLGQAPRLPRPISRRWAATWDKHGRCINGISYMEYH